MAIFTDMTEKQVCILCHPNMWAKHKPFIPTDSHSSMYHTK